MILVIDNSKDLSTAEMTPRLLEFLHYLGIPVYVASTRKQAHIALRQSHAIRGVILSGGPASVYEAGAPHVSEGVWRSIPQLTSLKKFSFNSMPAP